MVRQMTLGRLVPVFLIFVSGAAAQVSTQAQQYEPLTAAERAKWFGSSAFGPSTLAFSTVSAGLSTWRNAPEEWGPGWEGFGKRYGSSFGRRVIAKGVEAGAGALWGEDPRYRRVGEGPVSRRIGNVAKMTFLSYDRSGNTMPGYARFAGLSVSSYAATAWLPDRQRDTGDFFARIAVGLTGRITGNAMREFWPDLKRRMRKPKPSDELLRTPVK